MGRPSDYNETIADFLCQRISHGESLNKICQEEDMPGSSSVFRWLAASPEFREKYARAREAQMDAMAEEILEIADTGDPEEHNWLKLRVDTRKWLMSKLAPKKYGDKTTIAGDESAPLKVVFQRIAPNSYIDESSKVS